MKSKISILLAVLALVASTLACSLGGSLALDNARMAFDSEGKNVTTSFSPSDVFYVVADLSNAPVGTVVDAKWAAVSVSGLSPNEVFFEQSLTNDEEGFTGTVYFQLFNDSLWPTGTYKVELYLNGTLSQTVTFTVQ
ncbi:MAG: hypothetical protein ACOYZ8_11020 [Chloroflexota bacterium]